jgi:hypothetical protein
VLDNNRIKFQDVNKSFDKRSLEYISTAKDVDGSKQVKITDESFHYDKYN